MRFMRLARTIMTFSVLSLLALPAAAAEVEKSFDFELHSWLELDKSDGPVTLHRVRLDRKEGRLTKTTITRPFNQEYLETVLLQLEYTNESSSKWKARLSVRWLDAEGRVIDGFSANETLDKRSARKTTQFSLSSLKYGLEVAKTIEVSIHFEP